MTLLLLVLLLQMLLLLLLLPKLKPSPPQHELVLLQLLLLQLLRQQLLPAEMGVKLLTHAILAKKEALKQAGVAPVGQSLGEVDESERTVRPGTWTQREAGVQSLDLSSDDYRGIDRKGTRQQSQQKKLGWKREQSNRLMRQDQSRLNAAKRPQDCG